MRKDVVIKLVKISNDLNKMNPIDVNSDVEPDSDDEVFSIEDRRVVVMTDKQDDVVNEALSDVKEFQKITDNLLSPFSSSSSLNLDGSEKENMEVNPKLDDLVRMADDETTDLIQSRSRVLKPIPRKDVNQAQTGAKEYRRSRYTRVDHRQRSSYPATDQYRSRSPFLGDRGFSRQRCSSQIQARRHDSRERSSVKSEIHKAIPHPVMNEQEYREFQEFLKFRKQFKTQ
jgi:hypothetical protein